MGARRMRGTTLAARLAAGAILPLVAIGLVWTWQQWRYQRAAANEDWAAATRVWPLQAQGWRQLADRQLPNDPTSALRSAQRAVGLNRADWRVWRTLAQLQFETGDAAGAQASMAQMVARSRGFDAAWSYANLLLLGGDTSGFWRNAERALAMAPAGRLEPALQSCLTIAGGDWAQLEGAIAAAEATMPDCQRAVRLDAGYFDFLLGQPAEAASAQEWHRVVASACARQDASAFTQLGGRYLNGLLGDGDGPAAGAAWRQGLQAGIFAAGTGPSASVSAGAGAPTAGPNEVVDGDFRRPLVERAQPEPWPFAWRACLDCGPYVFRSPRNGLQLEFHGEQSAAVILARQWLLLGPGVAYRLCVQSRDRDASGGGVFVAIANDHDKPLARLVVPHGRTWRTAQTDFVTPIAAATYRLEIGYARPLGELPLSGDVWLRGLSVRALPAIPDGATAARAENRS